MYEVTDSERAHTHTHTHTHTAFDLIRKACYKMERVNPVQF